MPQSLPQELKGPAVRGNVALGSQPTLSPAGWLGFLLKGLSVFGFVLASAGCSTRSELGFMSLMGQVPATQAIIVPPPGGPAVVAVLQRRYQNGVTQEIALSTASSAPGQNAFYVCLVNEPEKVSEIDDTLRVRHLTQEIVQTEMEERLPGVDMRTSLLYAQNKYGPFGFATGRSTSGDLCLYAWQQIEPTEPVLFMPQGAISIRLRLCDAEATEAQLLRTMYAFTISAYLSANSWNPYGEPPPPPAYLGRLDAPVNPLAIGMTGNLSGPRRRAVTTRAVSGESEDTTRVIDKDTVLPSAPRPEPAPAAPAEAPAGPLPGYPVVPPPP